LSPAAEKQVGAEQHPKLVQEFGGSYDDPKVAAYVERVGQSLAQHSEIKDIQYSFTVIDDDGINAFALPGGYIHITRGLLTLASNEAELAGVLGHEIGHVTARHAAQRYSTATATSLGIGVLGIWVRSPECRLSSPISPAAACKPAPPCTCRATRATRSWRPTGSASAT
jgi:predicted Zn-dependent protease